MRTLLVTLSSATLATMMVGCALLTPTLESPKHNPAKVACESYRLITWAPGDEDAALKMLIDLSTGKRPPSRETLTLLREVAGDTSTTIREVKEHNAAFRALCTNPLATP